MRKKIFLTSILLLLLFSNSFGQISISEATKKVNEFISELQIEGYLLYKNPEIVNSETEIATFEKSIISVPFDAWVFFLDKTPLKGWSHPCSYIFVDTKSGKIIKKEWKLPPNDLDNWKLLTEIKDESEFKLFDFKDSEATFLKSGVTPANSYAVIISGGYNKASNWQRYWNDCSAIYSALVDKYNYKDDHIYTIISDGSNPANDRRVSGGYDSSPLDLDSDGDDDIQYSATRSNITEVFNILSDILDDDDFLYIFVTDHGGRESGQNTLIYLWGETIRDDQFATEVNKVNAGEISIVMEQCYSGGFVDDLASSNRVIATACDYDETSCGMGYYTYDEFVFDWIAAVYGEEPNGNTVDADFNEDGFISMKEAFDYAEAHDVCSETPQYNSNPSCLGNILNLNGKFAKITGPDPVCASNASYTLNNLPSDMSVTWSATPSHLFTTTSGSGSSFSTAWDGSGRGTGTITATLSGECGSVEVKKNVWVGKPAQPTTDPTGYPTIDMQLWGLLNVSLTNSPGATGTPVWWCTGSLRIDSENGNSCTFEAVEEGIGNFYVKTQNTCGYSPSAGGTVNVSTGGGGGTPDDPLEPLCFPNPADEQLTVTLAETEDAGGNTSKTGTQTKKDQVYEYQLYDLYYQLVREISSRQRKVRIKTNNLEEGFYFLKVVRGEKVWIKKIEVRH